MEANQDLIEARTALEEANEALKKVTRAQISEIKSLISCPLKLTLLLEYIFKLTGEDVEGWVPVKNALRSNPQLLAQLASLDPAQVDQKALDWVTAKITKDGEDWSPEALDRISTAGGKLNRWMLAFCKLSNLEKAAAKTN